MRVIFASGYAADVIEQRGMLEPGAAFLPKPLTPATLGGKVREVLDARRAAARELTRPTGRARRAFVEVPALLARAPVLAARGRR